jgi:hypothetical protein
MHFDAGAGLPRELSFISRRRGRGEQADEHGSWSKKERDLRPEETVKGTGKS